MESTNYRASDREWQQMEMSQKRLPKDAFFSLKNDSHVSRPMSVATEFVDSDWDEDDIISDEENSPRVSLQSLKSGQPSFTTVSSYEEAPTPRSSRFHQVHMVEQWHKPVEGPQGPHLFRASADESQLQAEVYDEDLILTLSPINSKAPQSFNSVLSQSQPARRTSPFQYTRHVLDKTQLASWTPEMVAQSMFNAGIELPMADRFIENDINGAILITLKFEDLRELDIPSFGIRTRVWHQIQALRDNTPASPRAETPIEDAPSREARHDRAIRDNSAGRQPSQRRQRRRHSKEDTIHPMESVSIIGIEQVIPKPHNCSKGENCSKWRKQQRLIEDFQRANPHIDMQAGGTFVVAGDAGNPQTARALNVNEPFRPFSDAIHSVVASSDVMGTAGVPALQYLHEATLRNAQTRETQANVRQFLAFQDSASNEVPPTPPYELAPAGPQKNQGLRRLPRLSIPVTSLPARVAPPRSNTVPPPQAAYQNMSTVLQQPRQPSPQEFVPYEMDKADPRSPDLETARNPYRFDTPFSEVDVPLTAVLMGPVSRDASQSVPPDMNYRVSPMQNAHSQGRSQSRASGRRPSFPVLPVVDEHRPVRTKTPSPKVQTPPQLSSRSPPQRPGPSLQQSRTWSPPTERSGDNQRAPFQPAFSSHEAPAILGSGDVSFQGPMKKRKMRLLRHEWQDGYFTLKGTRLNMHKDAQAVDRTLEYVDIDDYAIACSSLASTSKLSAAFKAVHISHNREKSDPVAAFSFQLIPSDKEKTITRLKKRESSVPAGNAREGVNGTGKTHHFAVKNRDERIDWMRELMLAKAMKQKGEGYELNHNGNMI